MRWGGRNEPNIHAVRQEANPDHWQGSELSVTILGSWPYYRAKVRDCMVQDPARLYGSLKLLGRLQPSCKG